MSTLSQLAVEKRLTIVEHLGTSSADGESLAGQNVNNFPAGSLFYVRASHRLYELRKNLDTLVVQTSLFNVIDGVGSSAAAGRFVAVDQWGAVTLAAGSGVLPGFDLSSGGFFLVSYTVAGGTQGFLHAAKTAANTVTVTSSSGSDTSTVLVVFKESPEAV